MAGVIDSNGQQWEHCGVCLEFVRIQDLLYEAPSKRFPHGLDIGPCCVDLPLATRNRINKAAVKKKVAESMARYAEMGWDVTLNPDNSITIHSCGEKK